MAITGVLFDFSGTLFRVEPAECWLRAVLAEAGIAVPEGELLHWADRLERAGALPGGAEPAAVPDRLRRLWEHRDESAGLHRSAYTTLSRETGLPWDLHEALYARSSTPEAWSPYPDAAEVLSLLKQRGLRVGVLSNIGWDLRPLFRAHGFAPFVDSYVLSFEHGIQKPDPTLFRIACDKLNTAPGDTLMVGDSRRADGGAQAIGCAFLQVPHLPVTERPDALRSVLGLLDGASPER
ncbi:HAD-IA family hydrolase [Streptomyces sp. ACA25]|uniref:HAD family hydrolase n=1 Tax=Streptomyces sp. ACA25 TaxID=3022596 RepID=UPI002307D46C|nr:HAD-IA family hydrolase [Streptomyces sp. ACA25]MDB1089689.1 HAD-IA family hydrolase [Streptomyces sp. ACA25]